MLIGLFPGLRALRRVVEWLALLALAVAISARLPATLDDPQSPLLSQAVALLATLLVFGLLAGIWTILKPVRKEILLLICRATIHSGVGVPLSFGAWELLSEFGPDELRKVYRAVGEKKQSRILHVAQQLAHSERCHVYREVVSFIDAVRT
jgi:hypothetical protein